MKKFLFILPLFLSGCTTITFFQSPKTLDKGKVEISVGMTEIGGCGGTFNFGLYEIFGQMRIGIKEKSDIGFRVFGKPSNIGFEEGGFVGIYGDYKKQLTDGPFYISRVLGLSYTYPFLFSVHPTIVMGTENFYSAARVIILFVGPQVAGLVPGLTFGAFIGKKFLIVPEVGVLAAMEESRVFLNSYFSIGISIRP